jgi:centrosomal protein CEP104
MAVRDENFDLAKQIKDTIDRLNSIGQQLTTLEEQKRLAISSEDFDAAKGLKIQIESLRQSAFHPAAAAQ